MSFNRIKYDTPAYDLKMKRATEPGDYRLFLAANESCDKCLSFDGPRNAKSDVSLVTSETTNQWGPMTEIESHITNRVNKLINHNEYNKNDSYKDFEVTNKIPCKEGLIAEDTRFTNPLESYRSMDTTNYKYSPFLHVNPQCEIQDDRIGLNSRLRVKDTFVVQRPNMIDQTPTLPRSTVTNITDVCKNF
jgi:hypothetical protein